MAVKDLTVGDPLRVWLKFSVPMVLSMIFQQLYTIVDSAIIGQCCSSQSFAAVSVSYPITVVFIALGSGAGIGVSVVTSHLFGEKHMDKVRTCAYTSLIATVVTAAVVTAIGIVGTQPLLALMNTDTAIFDEASAYLWIYIGGVSFLLLYNVCTGLFTALGDAVTPLWLLIGSSLLNVALDLWFVAGCGGGVAGAAWATFAAQGAACVTALVLILRRVGRLTAGRVPHWDRALLIRVTKVAVPSICQQSFISVGQLFVQGSINTFPTAVQSGYGGAFKINMFTISSLNTLANSLSAFVAQNTGARQWARVRQGRKAAMRLTLLFAAAVATAVSLGAWLLMSLFTHDDEIKRIGCDFLWTICPFYVIVTIKIINDGTYRGVGAGATFMTFTFIDLGLRVAASYVFPLFMGVSGVWWAYPFGWTVSTVLSMLWFRFGKWAYADPIRRASAL